MRSTESARIELGAVPVAEIRINARSRDGIPAVLLGLQQICTAERLREKVFALLESQVHPRVRKDTARAWTCGGSCAWRWTATLIDWWPRRVPAAGKKSGDILRGCCDACCVETDIHYPTDVSVLQDAMRRLAAKPRASQIAAGRRGGGVRRDRQRRMFHIAG